MRFAGAGRPEWQQFTVVGVIDSSPAFLRAVSDAGYLPALFVPLGVPPASRLPDGPALGRYLEARSTTGDSDTLLSELTKLAPAYLYPTYGLVTYRKYDRLAAAAQRFDVQRRALAVQVYALVAIAGVALLALKSQGKSRSGRGTVATSVIFLVGGCLLGVAVACLLVPYLMFPYLVHSVFLTVDTAELPFLTPSGIIKGILAAAVAVGFMLTSTAHGTGRQDPVSTPPAQAS